MCLLGGLVPWTHLTSLLVLWPDTHNRTNVNTTLIFVDLVHIKHYVPLDVSQYFAFMLSKQTLFMQWNRLSTELQYCTRINQRHTFYYCTTTIMCWYQHTLEMMLLLWLTIMTLPSNFFFQANNDYFIYQYLKYVLST